VPGVAPPEAFYSDKSTANGLYPYCKKCKAAIDAVGGAAYHAAHRDELNAKKRRYRAEQKAADPEVANQK